MGNYMTSPDLRDCGSMVSYTGTSFSPMSENPNSFNVGGNIGVQTLEFLVGDQHGSCHITTTNSITSQGKQNGLTDMESRTGFNLVF